MGPRPAAWPRHRRALSRSRAALLEMLSDQPEPVSQAALATASGLHANTVREHLEALTRDGLVSRQRAEPAGRGRPAWMYQATGGPGGSEYARLATALASVIHRTSASPREDGRRAGAQWGHELAEGRDDSDPHGGTGGTGARRRVIELLGDLGFAPEPDDRRRTVRLTRCPLLEAAHKYPDVVCAVHLGIVEGAMREYGADPTGADLLPFAESGACRLRLPAGSRRTKHPREDR